MAADGGAIVVYLGTYTRGESTSEGVYSCAFDTDSGSLSPLKLAARVENPSFLALHPTRPYLYATNELGEREGGRPAGGLSAFVMDGDGGLTFLNREPSHGTSPAYVCVEATGRYALVANYGTGNLAMLPIRSDGSLGPASDVVQHEGSSVHPQRQRGPHAHSVIADPRNRFALAADLGLDKVLVYRMDLEGGTLEPNDPPWATVAAGQGPRHLAFHPNGRYLYLINEIGSTLTAFAWDGERGALEEIGTVSTLPEGWAGTNYCADVHVARDGRFVYGSNRGHDSIAVFAVDGATGMVTPVGYEPTLGEWPRNFRLSPDGRWLLAANQNTDNLVVFRVDPDGGALERVGRELQVPRPVCVLFAP